MPHSMYLLSTMLLATVAVATQFQDSEPGLDQAATVQPRAFAIGGEFKAPIFTSESKILMPAPQQRWVF